MDGFSLVLGAVMSALVALLMIAMPGMIRNTLPLGVSVPHARVAEPVIRASIRTFRITVLAVLVAVLLLAVLLARSAPALAASLPVLVLVAGSTLAYVAARGRIVRAKRAGGWYDDVPVRLTASITRETHRGPQPFGWYLAALVVLAVIIGIGVARYPSFPDPLPIHWNGSGQVDGYAAKSAWSAFGPLMIAVGIVALLYLCSFLTRLPVRVTPSGDPAESARRAGAAQRALESLLGQLALAITVTVAWVTLAGWLAPGTAWLIVAGLVLMVVLIVAAIGAFFVRYRRETAPAAGSNSEEPGRTDAPDDDRYWKAGIFYVNRRDPAIMVPKRFGIGWTINLGSPGGIAGGIVLLLAIAAGIVLPLV